MQEFWLILGMFLVTFGIRYVMFAFANSLKFSPRLEQALRYVPPTVLTAIIVPAVLYPHGEFFLSWRNPYLLAAIISIVLAFKTRDLLKTIAIGMLIFFILRYLLA
ncbi:AzlD domain-containing protein [Alginatibacterium sediminis]|uniref:AzlD domain-containing protein n=1 Tax=Alginatibacterium sediminis TaxID=2164068 RepID=A0A420E6T2_9ALTE|nr:AzlD domain-containing protein [Alginatibacterium sediminis]RKF14252.1 AzlD domain-containing protein [Alginatibacterium sediminis]